MKKVFIFLFGSSTGGNVKISEKGWEILNNRTLASEVVTAITKNKSNLLRGEQIIVGKYKIKLL